MKIRQVGQGAYFVPSYSEQTIIHFQPSITNQTVTTKEFEEDIIPVTLEGEDIFTKIDFEKALKKASHRVNK
ncbi:MAG TPA: hypothetical protein VMV84_02100 [Dehalococcoidales bacterium]|nr:hypothetical protein [Dehalococcoidales bacterium]